MGQTGLKVTGVPVAVLGAGAWGTAVAIALAQRHPVKLWGRNSEAMQRAQSARENHDYLPGLPFPELLEAVHDFDAAVEYGKHGLLIAACPVAGLRPLAQKLQNYQPGHLVWLCKGFEGGASMLPHQIVAEELGRDFIGGALYGPSFAQEFARGLPCALTIASHDPALREKVVRIAHGGSVRVYTSDDVTGVEVGGAVKNIMAIATGIADGLGLGMNARAALITRGLAEISRLGVALGGHAETFMGLTGVGDLILTCTGDLSRNRKVGLGLAAGKPLQQIVDELGHVAEGVPCARSVRALAARMQIDMPITNAVAGVLFDGDNAREMVARLLARDPRDENA
ncbi:NAD(P)H-dependent glycerol-3-phosphate dehydrogenase [Massilia sp. W12]|uniref:NAD(P)H-dependent glycerol-3-phosphate dehydrogenase n=1 Tax=Massilia sp. W12 TaxID=3126507 RepID=UPI0030CB073E